MIRYLPILLVVFAAPTLAQPTAPAATTLPALQPPTFVAPVELDLKRVLPPWPVAGTLASEADVQTVLAIQQRRTNADEVDAQADSVTTMADFTRNLLGPQATPERYPRLFALMAALHQDMRGVNRAANEAQGYRLRPVLFDSRIKPSLDMVGHGAASYPSARTSSGQVWADVIALIIPEKAAEAQAEAERIAWRRVVGGVHYPSDLAGSRHVARAVKQALEQSPKFQTAVESVKRELATDPIGPTR